MIQKEFVFYDITICFLNAIIDFFFREIQPRGSHLIPSEGAVMFVGAPHCNQFLDPLLLARFTNKRVSFLCAKKSMDRLVVGLFARLTNSIPVSRAQDHAFKGTGTIKVKDSIKEPLKIIGLNTLFKTQLKKGFVLCLPKNKGNSEIVEIINDTELIIRSELKGLDALELLTRDSGTNFLCIPHVDQNKLYSAVHEALNNNAAIGIFPEGGSHDRTELLPLKAGIAIMTLGAMCENPNLDVKIVPCGLNYFHPHKFRSRAVVEYGNPIKVDKVLVEKYRLGGEQKREACAALLSQVSTALKNITINTPDYETLIVTQAARRLYKPSKVKLKMSHVLELNRKLVVGYLHYKDNPKVIELKNKILQYNTLLKDYGIKDHQVKSTSINRTKALILLFKRLIMLGLMAFFAVPGTVLNLPVVIASKIITKKKQREALASSTVKIKARDVVSSWKVIIALVVTPILHIIYATIASVTIYAKTKNIMLTIITPFVCIIVLFLVSYYSVIVGTYAGDVYRSLRPLTLAIIGRVNVKQLSIIRGNLTKDITELIEEYGPKIFPDFDKNRILMPSSTTNKHAPLTPSSASALNWIMSPFEAIGERIASELSINHTPTSVLSRNSSFSELKNSFTPMSSKIDSNKKEESDNEESENVRFRNKNTE